MHPMNEVERLIINQMQMSDIQNICLHKQKSTINVDVFFFLLNNDEMVVHLNVMIHNIQMVCLCVCVYVCVCASE